jgi:hypothetical protein
MQHIQSGELWPTPLNVTNQTLLCCGMSYMTPDKQYTHVRSLNFYSLKYMGKHTKFLSEQLKG